jgi:hypothetical protein
METIVTFFFWFRKNQRGTGILYPTSPFPTPTENVHGVACNDHVDHEDEYEFVSIRIKGHKKASTSLASLTETILAMASVQPSLGQHAVSHAPLIKHP